MDNEKSKQARMLSAEVVTGALRYKDLILLSTSRFSRLGVNTTIELTSENPSLGTDRPEYKV